ncbi:FdtA/QdtA family cupin domain-containing protein [Haliea sp.]|uniref:sugar 3,4-ketoisomerase n=1 Tax=Haliea sp. TaxID=1932666 RepID=UPI00352805A6
MTLPAPEATRWFGGAARLVPVQRHNDSRGSLLPVDFAQLPFRPERVFTVSAVPPGTRRGGHGHLRGQQLLICLTGKILVTLQRDGERVDITLDGASPGLSVSAGIWGEQTYIEEHSTLLVLASDPYDADSYFSLVGAAP